MKSNWFGPASWLAYVLPLAVFVAAGAFEPSAAAEGRPASLIPYALYPGFYGLKILLTVAAIAWCWPAIDAFPRRCGFLAIAVGIVGAVIWIGLGELHGEARFFQAVHLEGILGGGARAAFNPLAYFADQPGRLWTFVAVRLFGLAVVVPIAEELFLRGFLIRWFVDPDGWPQVPFGRLTTLSAVLATVLPMTYHPPGELFAVAVWFSLVTWLMYRTRSFWDCVIAHAITNLLLGMYVLATGHWWFW